MASIQRIKTIDEIQRDLSSMNLSTREKIYVNQGSVWMYKYKMTFDYLVFDFYLYRI